MDQSDLEALAAAKASQQDAARPEIVTRIHAGAKLTARERINAVLDAGSAVEFGAIAARTQTGEWVPEAGGVDFVGTINSHPVIVSSTDYTDKGGGYGAGRLGRLFALAYEQRWPVLLFVDGGGSRARHPRAGLGHMEMSGSVGRFSFLDGMPELSGWVPTVAIVSGPAFAGHASLAGFSDFLISTPGSSIGMGGPPMVEAALGQRLSPNELAGAEMHETAGGIDLLVADEHAAIDTAKRILDFYQEPVVDPQAAEVMDLDALAVSQELDVRDVIAGLCDGGTVFELRPAFAPALITAFARLEGRSVGVIANQRKAHDGAIDHDAATKLARFVETCNAYEYPIVTLVDSPGCQANWIDKKANDSVEPGLTRWHTRAIIAHQQRTVPLFSVQLGRGGGLAPALMNGVSSTRGVPVLRLAWPSSEIAKRDGFSAVLDHAAFDDVIAPCETRERLARALRLCRKTPSRDRKKHWIDHW